jgi:hypothetical protein
VEEAEMAISEIGMATIARLRLRRSRRTRMAIVRILPATAVALVGMMMVGGAAFARPVGTTDVRVSPNERTEGEKFANNYGYGITDREATLGRTPQELRIQRALESLARSRQAVFDQRTEGEKFANNYGYGSPIDRIAGVAATRIDRLARVESTHADRLAGIEATGAERFASNHFRFGPDSRGASVATVPSESPVVLPEPGTSWESMAITASLVVLLGGTALLIVRRRHPSSAV